VQLQCSYSAVTLRDYIVKTKGRTTVGIQKAQKNIYYDIAQREGQLQCGDSAAIVIHAAFRISSCSDLSRGAQASAESIAKNVMKPQSYHLFPSFVRVLLKVPSFQLPNMSSPTHLAANCNSAARPKRGAAGLRGQVMQVELESIEESAVHREQQQHAKQKRKRSGSSAPAAFNKRHTATAAAPTVTTHLISAQRRLQLAGGAGTGVKASELAWYHAEWAPVDEEFGEQVTQEIIPALKQCNARMRCTHCSFERSFNPSTRYKEHLLLHCRQFSKTEAFQAAVVQNDLRQEKEKRAKKAGVCISTFHGTAESFECFASVTRIHSCKFSSVFLQK
jgi:hypothetical protein